MGSEEVELDCIDEAIESLAKRFFGEEDYDEEQDLDVILDFIGDMIDEEEIPDFPDEDASDDELQAWVDVNIPVIESRLNQETEDLGKLE